MTTTHPPSPFAAPPRRPAGAIVAVPGLDAGATLTAFAADLGRRGFAIRGLVQETTRGADGRKTAMTLIDLESGRRIGFTQSLGSGAAGCIVDEGGLAEAAPTLSRAVDERADLVVVNKFSHLEREGRGFHAELLAALAEGVPVLTMVPAEAVADWLAFTGGATALLAPEPRALWRWWGPERLYEDLIRAVPPEAGAARRVVIGLNWVMVEGPHGCGLAHAPDRGTTGCSSVPGGPFAGRPLADLATLLRSANPAAAAIGLAAVNAHLNRPDAVWEQGQGLDAVPRDARVVAVGAFPGLAERFPDLTIIERAPGHAPAEAAPWVLAGADAAVLTASALANRTLPGLLHALPDGADAVLLGPGTPLTPRLFAYGPSVLAGFVVDDVEGCARAVAEGATTRGLKPFGRAVVLRPVTP